MGEQVVITELLRGINSRTKRVSLSVRGYDGESDTTLLLSEWQHFQLSQYASEAYGPIFGNERSYVCDRMYAAILLYGRVLRRLQIAPEIQNGVHGFASDLVTGIREKGFDAETFKLFTSVSEPQENEFRRFRTVVYRDRENHLNCQDYYSMWRTGPDSLAADAVFGLMSAVNSCNETELRFFSTWLASTNRIFMSYGANIGKNYVFAASRGFDLAIGKQTDEFAESIGVQQPQW
jgi:hypothetical protein